MRKPPYGPFIILELQIRGPITDPSLKPAVKLLCAQIDNLDKVSELLLPMEQCIALLSVKR